MRRFSRRNRGATSVQGVSGSNTGHSRRSGGSGGGGGSFGRSSGGGSHNRGASEVYIQVQTLRQITQASAINTQNNSTAVRFIGAIEGGRMITRGAGEQDFLEKGCGGINSINQEEV